MIHLFEKQQVETTRVRPILIRERELGVVIEHSRGKNSLQESFLLPFDIIANNATQWPQPILQ